MPAILVYTQVARHTPLATGTFHYNEGTIPIYVLFGVYQPGTLNPEWLNLVKISQVQTSSFSLQKWL
jgi:hypothetical protein